MPLDTCTAHPQTNITWHITCPDRHVLAAHYIQPASQPVSQRLAPSPAILSTRNYSSNIAQTQNGISQLTCYQQTKCLLLACCHVIAPSTTRLLVCWCLLEEATTTKSDAPTSTTSSKTLIDKQEEPAANSSRLLALTAHNTLPQPKLFGLAKAGAPGTCTWALRNPQNFAQFFPELGGIPRKTQTEENPGLPNMGISSRTNTHKNPRKPTKDTQERYPGKSTR
eukprot:jgi/Psemu1/42225/gm1.42225_g